MVKIILNNILKYLKYVLHFLNLFDLFVNILNNIKFRIIKIQQYNYLRHLIRTNDFILFCFTFSRFQRMSDYLFATDRWWHRKSFNWFGQMWAEGNAFSCVRSGRINHSGARSLCILSTVNSVVNIYIVYHNGTPFHLKMIHNRNKALYSVLLI